VSGSPVAPATVNLKAGSVNLTTTGTGSSIGSAHAFLSTDIAALTAATNDGRKIKYNNFKKWREATLSKNSWLETRVGRNLLAEQTRWRGVSRVDSGKSL
jgi:hypothetical protein